jgi:putative glutamine amidotransferase
VAVSELPVPHDPRPLIGITAGNRPGRNMPPRVAVNRAYVSGLQAALLDRLDALLFPGGLDVGPVCYGERPRPELGDVDEDLDALEMPLVRTAVERGIPVFGICRGQQVINVALGGSLVQHLDDHDIRGHGRSHLAHSIKVDPGSELGQAAGEHHIRVNSFHHQAVKDLARGLRETALGEDGTVEGVESDDGLIVAVQCHPEELTTDLPWARRLFERFVARAARKEESGC